MEAYLHHEKLTSAANIILCTDLKSRGKNLVEINVEWKMMIYSNGHFKDHSDLHRPI